LVSWLTWFFFCVFVFGFADSDPSGRCYPLIEKTLLKILAMTASLPNPENANAPYRLNDRVGMDDCFFPARMSSFAFVLIQVYGRLIKWSHKRLLALEIGIVSLICVSILFCLKIPLRTRSARI
jgi:hypothetical protein